MLSEAKIGEEFEEPPQARKRSAKLDMAEKCRIIGIQDAEWAAALPDQFDYRDAKKAWGICLQETRRRLTLLRISGLIRRVWAHTNQRVRGIRFVYWEKLK